METNIYKKLFEVKKAWIKLQRDTKAFNYKYATLSQIQEKLWEVMQEQGLVIVHSIQDNKVRTSISDIETEWQVYSEIPMSEWTKPQDKGSEITYYRRYNLLSLLDLEVEDDDWKKAQDSKTKDKKKWLNYEELVNIAEAWNITEVDVKNIIKEDWYMLSNNAKNAVRHYVETGELDKNLFYDKR